MTTSTSSTGGPGVRAYGDACGSLATLGKTTTGMGSSRAGSGRTHARIVASHHQRDNASRSASLIACACVRAVAAAMGVPASVIFEGKFSSNSMSQLQLLNTTVQHMALAVNKVLTACYHVCYRNAPTGDELVLLTAPLASTTEVQDLFVNGVIDIESALPAALHSLGASAEEIEGALKRRRKAEKGSANTELMAAQTAQMVGDADVALKGAQAEKTTAEIEAVKAGVEKTHAEVGKVNADAKKAEHDAKAPFPSAAPKPAGGASKGGGSSSGAKKK